MYSNEIGRKLRLAAAAAIVGAVALAGTLTGAAQAQDNEFGTKLDQALHDTLPADYQKNGVKVAVFNDWPPDEFVENGELKGWSVDMAKAMSTKLGVPFQLTGTSFDAIIPGLTAKRFDAGFSSFGVTAERLKALDFIPQRREGTAYAYLTDKPQSINDTTDLCGHSVAVLTGAWDYQYLQTLSADKCTGDKKPIDLQQFTTQNNAELAVSSGRVEMVAAGSAKLLYLAKQTGKFTVSKLQVNPVFNGIGVRKDDPLGASLKDALQALMDEGAYKAILAKWGMDKQGVLDKAVLVNETNPNPT